MKSTDLKALEQLNFIDEDLIAGAEKAPKRLNLAPVYGIAAAAIIGLISLAVINPFKKPDAPAGPGNSGNTETVIGKNETTQAPNNNTSAPIATSPANTEPVPDDEKPTGAPITKQILYAQAGTNTSNVEYIPAKGSTNIASPLSHEILKEEYKDCLFAVRISICNATEDLWHELTAQADALYKAKISNYDKMMDTWEATVKPSDLTWPEYYGYSAEEFWTRGKDHIYFGLKVMYEDFNNYLKDKMPEEEYNDLMVAHKEYLELLNERDGEGGQISQLYNEIAGAEVERLRALGLDVSLEDTDDDATKVIVGFLTPDQITNFPVSQEYSYMILWLGHDNAVNE